MDTEESVTFCGFLGLRPSTNPLDAYVQLTKRTAYKSIPDIKKVDVYAGFLSGRLSGEKPVRTFSSDELVFVTLL